MKDFTQRCVNFCCNEKGLTLLLSLAPTPEELFSPIKKMKIFPESCQFLSKRNSSEGDEGRGWSTRKRVGREEKQGSGKRGERKNEGQ